MIPSAAMVFMTGISRYCVVIWLQGVFMKTISIISAVPLSLLVSISSEARTLAVGPEHFHFVIEAKSKDRPEVLWARLIAPAQWWHANHTYSGDANNLSLDPRAGGLWREDWDGGSVAHGKVLYAKPPTLLRLEAPFGPLQEKAIDAIWTISISPLETGSSVTFEFIANGSAFSKLDELAPAVEMVKTQALKTLVQPIANEVSK